MMMMMVQPQRNSTLRTVHDPGGMGLTPHNVSLPFISALVCIDCQCQKPPIFHLVMRSDLQTRSQETTLLSTVRVVIELYLLAASATWTIKRLSASSCEQEASPSMSLGCRKITSLSIVHMTLSVDLVTIYLPIQCQLYVLYPVAVTHTVGTHHGHMIRRKFRSLHASVRTRLLVHLTQQRRRWCHLTPLGHLLGIEQCPIWCPV